jgi:hypothetical protein
MQVQVADNTNGVSFQEWTHIRNLKGSTPVALGTASMTTLR